MSDSRDRSRRQPFQSRPVAMGSHGAVSTPHLLASETAIEVLKAGGNAVDAAVAAAAVCTVVQPFSSSIGGVGWATVYDRSSATTEVLQFHGCVPLGIDPQAFVADDTGLVDWRRLEAKGSALLASLTPGVVSGWEELLARKGRWSLARVLERAIDFAVEGIPVSELLQQVVVESVDRLRRWPASSKIFLPEDRPLRLGERLVQTDLGRTLERIARNGAAEVTSGETGRSLVDFYGEHGGRLSEIDLANYRPRWYDPLVGTYRGYLVHAAPAPLGDVTFMAGLKLLELFGPFSSPLDPEYVHVSVESAKLIRADRARYLGDDADPAAIERLLAPEYLREVAAHIGPIAAARQVRAQPPHDTITLVVVDEDGNAVHLMQTVGSLFGTGAVAGQTGIVTNSSLYFVYAGGTGANQIVPGRRVEQNPCTNVIFDAAGNLRLIAGSPGGKSRVETVRQMIVNVVDFGMNVQQAVDAARFLSSDDGISVDFEAIYGAVEPHLLKALEARGHRVEVADVVLGTGQAVEVDPRSGTRLGAADWRLESVALAY